MTLLLSLVIYGSSSSATQVFARCVRALTDAFIMDDPYQFEQHETDWLKCKREQLMIKRKWNTLSEADAVMLRIIDGELTRRLQFESRRDQ